MGLLDMLFSGNNGGLFGGQYENPPSQGFGALPTQGPIFAGAPLGQIMGGMAPLAGAPPQQSTTAPLSPTEQQMMSLLGRPGYQPGRPDAGQSAAAAPASPAATNDAARAAMAAPMAVGNYQMPRMGSPDLYQPEQVNTPPQAQPAQGQAAPQTLPPALGGANFGGNFGAGLQSFVNTPGGLIQKILGGVTGGITGQRTDPVGLDQQNKIAQYQAFIGAGLTPQNAMLAVLNPEAGKTLINEALTNKQEFKTIKDALGGEHGYWVDKVNQTMKPAEGGAGGAPGMTAGAPSVLAQGVTYDPSKSGEDYLTQFSPDVKAAVKAYMNGDVMPSGNPRNQTIASYAKTVAQRYGQDMGIPVSDNLYNEKRKLRTDLGSSSNNSMGGILDNGESSFSHLAELGKSFADLGSASYDFPLGGAVAHAQNYLGSAAASSKTLGKIKATGNNLDRYGQESTKFYAGSGGGVEERTRARKEMNPEVTSAEEQASFLEKEKSLMVDRLQSKFDHMRNTLGEAEANREIAKHMPGIDKNIAEIDKSIKKLRGEEEATTTPAPAGSPKPGAYVWSPDKGIAPK